MIAYGLGLNSLKEKQTVNALDKKYALLKPSKGKKSDRKNRVKAKRRSAAEVVRYFRPVIIEP